MCSCFPLRISPRKPNLSRLIVHLPATAPIVPPPSNAIQSLRRPPSTTHFPHRCHSLTAFTANPIFVPCSNHGLSLEFNPHPHPYSHPFCFSCSITRPFYSRKKPSAGDRGASRARGFGYRSGVRCKQRHGTRLSAPFP